MLLRDIAKYFNRNQKTLSSMYQSYIDQINEGVMFPDLAPKKEGNVGRKSELTPQIEERLRTIRQEHRGNLTLRLFAVEYEERYDETLATSTIRRYLHEMGLFQSRSYLKPVLTDAQKLSRLEYIVRQIGNGKSFSLNKNRIHMDEKWFYVVREGRLRWLDPNEPVDTASVHKKQNVTKVMFLVAIGLPHKFNHNGEEQEFDGKIGCWAFTEQTLAKRDSVNRPAGTELTVSQNVTSSVYYEMIREKVIPAIRKKLPHMKEEGIIVQHDGAPSHTGKGNVANLNEAGLQRGWNITFEVQPAQSPDLNKCDLCFFNSLQLDSERHRKGGKIEELIVSVENAFKEYDSDKLARVHALASAVFREIMEDMVEINIGPLTKIRKREDDGSDPWDLSVPKGLLRKTKNEIERSRTLLAPKKAKTKEIAVI